MDNDLSSLAKNLTDALGGKDKKKALENVIRLFSSENGRKVLSQMMSDGGADLRFAAEAAKRGDLGGLEKIISKISETPEGASLLHTISDEMKR